MIQGRSEYGPNAMTYKGGGKVIIPLPYTKHQKKDGTINGQGVFEFADSSFLFGTYADNGCGAIALYNAMQLLSSPQSLGNIEDDLFMNGGILAGGHMGVAPWAINDYFHAHGYTCSGYFSFEKLHENIKEGSIVVFLVLNSGETAANGAHYMAVLYHNNKYEIYNVFSDSLDSKTVPCLDSFFPNNRWLYGYIIGG